MIREVLGGSACIETTWEIRLLDEHGDAIDIWPFDTTAEADEAWFVAIRTMGTEGRSTETKAIVMEKHEFKSPAHLFEDPNTFKVLRWAGSDKALREGGWLDK